MLLVLRGIDERLDLAGDAFVVPGDLPERRVRVGKREEPLVVRLGLLDESPVVAERLHVGLPDRADVLVTYGPDLETVRECMVGEIVDGRAHHLGGVRDRFVTGGAVQRRRSDVSIVVPDLEELFADVMLARDLTQPALVPREERRADPAASHVWIEEADVLVQMWSVGFLVPPDAAIRHGAAVHLRDDEVAVGIAPLEVLVPGGDSLDSLDAFVADSLRPGGDDSREVRVVGRPRETRGTATPSTCGISCVVFTSLLRLGNPDRQLPCGHGTDAPAESAR